MSIKNIIFDWSGTLSDDFTPVYQASMLLFEQLGEDMISVEEFRRELVIPYMLFWNKYFPELSQTDEEKMFSEALHKVDEPKLYDGVRATLEKVKSSGMRMIVISSHPHVKLVKEAHQYGVDKFFVEINGGIHDETEVISEILKRNDFQPKETLYVGDMTHDIEAGKQDGVVTVAIGWGYQSKEKLMSAHPDFYISDIAELVGILEIAKL